jgi:hypothetical protein
MAATTLPNLQLVSGYLLGEDGWQVPMNRNLRTIDALTQARVLDKDLTDPPTSPTAGELYIVGGTTPTGAWAGQAGKLALTQSGDDAPGLWRFITPKSGWRVYVVDEAKYYTFNGSTWGESTGDVSTAANLGGTGLYAQKSGAQLQFKGLSAEQGVALNVTGTTVGIRTVYISATDPGAVGAGVIWVTP